jgi:hypothetical protein
MAGALSTEFFGQPWQRVHVAFRQLTTLNEQNYSDGKSAADPTRIVV